mmetsp:Transcript_5995/g.16835  ORF Transcript_5995/g.16835 Transcript_5995/m.16835 type:complete len:224 (+) Transcript_5995:504-1175(+)
MNSRDSCGSKPLTVHPDDGLCSSIPTCGSGQQVCHVAVWPRPSYNSHQAPAHLILHLEYRQNGAHVEPRLQVGGRPRVPPQLSQLAQASACFLDAVDSRPGTGARQLRSRSPLWRQQHRQFDHGRVAAPSTAPHAASHLAPLAPQKCQCLTAFDLGRQCLCDLSPALLARPHPHRTPLTAIDHICRQPSATPMVAKTVAAAPAADHQGGLEYQSTRTHSALLQ